MARADEERRTDTGKPITGKILVNSGSGKPLEVTVEDLKTRNRNSLWNAAVEAEYMERVRAKAAAKAQEIVSLAMTEAEHLKQQAQEEGYAQGVATAQEQLAAAHQDMADSLAQALASVDVGRRQIWDDYRQDIVTLLGLAVEKILGIELGTRRNDILGHLLDQALDSIDAQRGLTIRVNPQDAETMREILDMGRERHPGLERWRLKNDPTMQPGGLIVESGQGIVDNSLESRMALVQSVLDQLEIPGEEQDA